MEFTGTKRFSNKWQMQAGLTIGRNRGGINTPTIGSSGQSSTNDLNDPNFSVAPEGIVGNDSTVAFRLSGSYTLPLEINLAGSLISNNGYPYQSTYSISRAFAQGQGVNLTRATQVVRAQRARRRAFRRGDDDGHAPVARLQLRQPLVHAAG